ncbi:hypothetical protein VTO42DRAFT_1731 [Malbranchea cinnamomea]
MQLVRPYPIRRYVGDPFEDATATYEAGKIYTVSVGGGDSHGGGSCQFSLSYDGGKTFRVVKSIVGSCPLLNEYAFTVPSDAPAGEALFAWTWFNRLEKILHRTERTRRRGWGRQRTADDVPFDQRPEMFVANIGNNPRCKTIDGEDVLFPDPGPDVEYGYKGGPADRIGYACSTLRSSGDITVTPAVTAMTTAALDEALLSTQSPIIASIPREPVPTTAVLRPSFAASASPTPRASASDESAFPGPCVPFSTCVPIPWPFPTPLSSESSWHGAVQKPTWAPARASPVGAPSKDGFPPAAAAAAAPCTPYTVKCHSNSTYSICVEEEVYVYMGTVSRGVKCDGDKIRIVQ